MTYNFRTQEAEAAIFLGVQGEPGLPREIHDSQG